MDEVGSSKSSERSCPTLLCIDDDPQIVETFRLRLRDYEVEVLSAYHGMHGFWQAMKERPDLIVTDLRMPQGRGDYLIRCLRNNSDTRSIPVIVLTGQRDPELVGTMRQLGTQEFFTKPVPFQTLLGAISKYIPLKKRAAEAETGPAERCCGFHALIAGPTDGTCG